MKTLLRFLVFIVGSMLIFPMASFAAQFDAPYNKFEKKHGAEWAKEDKAIDAKLAALEKKFVPRQQRVCWFCFE